MSSIPSIQNYGPYDYKGQSYQVNVGMTTFYFSYRTIIAFDNDKTGLVVSANDWGPTTGKHLNWISEDKKSRLPRTEFLEKLGSLNL